MLSHQNLKVAASAGNAEAVKRLVRERAPAHGKRLLWRVWGVRKAAGGALALPQEAAAENPLLAAMWARFQEGCRLLHASGGPPCVRVAGRHLQGGCLPWRASDSA